MSRPRAAAVSYQIALLVRDALAGVIASYRLVGREVDDLVATLAVLVARLERAAGPTLWAAVDPGGALLSLAPFEARTAEEALREALDTLPPDLSIRIVPWTAEHDLQSTGVAR